MLHQHTSFDNGTNGKSKN